LSIAGAYLYWPSYIPNGGLPKWIAQIEAGICGAFAAMLVGTFFGQLRASVWVLPIAGLLTIWGTLLFMSYLSYWSFALFIHQNSPVIAFKGVWEPAFAFVFWLLFFTVDLLKKPSTAILHIAAIVGAMLLVRKASDGKAAP
jgi:hypothetical protein